MSIKYTMLNFRLYIMFSLFPATLMLSAGCSPQSGSDAESSLTVTLPESFGLAQKSGTPLEALSRKSCFAVSITGADLPAQSSGSCDATYGVFVGLAAPGETLSIAVPKGLQRTVSIYYVASDRGCLPFKASEGLGKTFGSNRVYRIGQLKKVDMNKAQVNLKVPVQLPSLKNSLAALNPTFPATCKLASATLQTSPYVRTSQGSGIFEIPSTGEKMKLRISDKSLDLSAPSGADRILPIGVEL